MEVVATTANTLFQDALSAILTQGTSASPRGRRTLEVTGVQLRLHDTTKNFVTPDSGRRLNPAFAVAEALWIMSGTDAPWIHDYNSQLSAYVGDGAPEGAYGPRIRNWQGIDQFKAIMERFSTDPDSRRAVIQIFDPRRDHGHNTDVPCTLNYRFLVRSDRLHMFTTMRSQDVWLGLPYDLFSATTIQHVIADWLDVTPGPYTISIDSLHLYEEHFERAERAAEVRPNGDQPKTSLELPCTEETLSPWVQATLQNRHVPGEGDWRSVARMLAAHRTGKYPSDANRLGNQVSALEALEHSFLDRKRQGEGSK